MGFRYDLKHLDSQQRALVAKRDQEEKLRQEEIKRNQIECEKIPPSGDYEGIYLVKNGLRLLELRISKTAIVNEPCKLNEVNITNWLCKVGKQHIDKVKDFEIITISSSDVVDQKLINEWDYLIREKLKEDK